MSEQKKIYLVSSGSYSDYGIRSVWSTRELADAEVVRFNTTEDARYDEGNVEEYWLDEATPSEWSLWSVCFRKPYDAQTKEYGEAQWFVDRIETKGRLWGEEDRNTDDGCRYCRRAPDAERALMSAVRCRAEWLAQKGVTR